MCNVVQQVFSYKSYINIRTVITKISAAVSIHNYEAYCISWFCFLEYAEHSHPVKQNSWTLILACNSYFPLASVQTYWIRTTCRVCMPHAGSASAERVGQGEVGWVTRRVTCTWWLLGLAVKVPWLWPGGPIIAMLSVGAIRFEDRFCASRKGGTGGGGWVHRFGWQCMAAVAAGYRMGLVSAGWPLLLLSCATGVENGTFTL